MAKRAKARASKARAGKPQSEAAAPSDVIKVPSEGKLKALLRACKGADADRNEASGRKGSLISNAVERDHLDKKAWSYACALEKMSQQKGAITWSHLLHYVECLGLQEKFDQQEEMFARPEIGEAEEEADVAAVSNGKGAKPPRAGSFAEKMKQQQQRTTTLTDVSKGPTPEEIKRVADRAEGTTH